MQRIVVGRVWIDEHCRLCVRPEDVTVDFRYIYRTASGVVWDEELRAVRSPAPREWSVTDWFLRILTDVRSEYGVEFALATSTEWFNVTESERASMEQAFARIPPVANVPTSDVVMAERVGDNDRRQRARELFREQLWSDVVRTLEDVRYPQLLGPSEQRLLRVARLRAAGTSPAGKPPK